RVAGGSPAVRGRPVRATEMEGRTDRLPPSLLFLASTSARIGVKNSPHRPIDVLMATAGWPQWPGRSASHLATFTVRRGKGSIVAVLVTEPHSCQHGTQEGRTG